MNPATGTILIIALSGFLMGFDGSLFTGAVLFVKGQFGLGDMQLGWTVSSHTLSATLSIFLAGPLADRLGRRAVLRIAALAFALSAVMGAFASSYPMLIVARLLSGVGVGSVLVAAPMYIAELSAPELRGRMVTVTQLFIVLGIFLASASNLLIIRLEHLSQDNWRWMLGIGVVPAVLYLACTLFVPESPRWHALHGQMQAARLGDLWAPELRRVLIIGLVVGVVQQITGINSVLAYATMIFTQASGAAAGVEVSFVQTLLITMINVVFTVVALLLIDRVGRRPLMLLGTAGIAISLTSTALGFHLSGGALHSNWVLGGLLSFVASFALSLGPGMWVLFSEIFPNRVRGLAISCVGLVNSAVCFLAQLVFPWQMEHLGGARTFLIYAMFAVLGLALLARILPETRGRSLEELEETLVRHE